MRSFDPSPRIEFDSWVDDRYDVVYFSTAAIYDQLGRPRLGPTIVDLVDLEDVKVSQRAALLEAAPSRGGVSGSLHRAVAIAQARKNARDWRALQHSVGNDVDRVLLCSDADVRRSRLANATVIPNSYPKPTRSVGQVAVGDPPVVLFQGTLTYPPNMDAVTWLVEEIAPRLREKLPDLQIRLVGKPAPGVAQLDRSPAVSVVGAVKEMEPELARADVAVVPLRIGSGTRLKILESFAHRVPVVSTSVGADGLDVEDDVHLLLADTADAFASACLRALTDSDLRERLVDAAEDLFLRRYEWSSARAQLQQLLRDVAGHPEVI
ncbi:MAG: glycosyltransferase family 4 protein [Acidimicrobiales bacterium]